MIFWGLVVETWGFVRKQTVVGTGGLGLGLDNVYLRLISCRLASLVSSQETEIRTLQRKLARRDNEILRQERELHKLRVR